MSSIGYNILLISLLFGLTSIDPVQLTVSDGHITKISPTSFSIRNSSIRGEFGKVSRNEVETSFIYRGPSSKVDAFASGEIRRQIGLKLKAQDTCNVIYIMWYIGSGGGIHAAIKNNPGQNTHPQCKDQGYISMKPSWSKPIKPIDINEMRTLRAVIIGTELQVFVDDVVAWRGLLPKEAFTFDGPVGIRTDNGDFDIELKYRP